MNYIIKYSYIQVGFLAALLLVYARKNLSKQARPEATAPE
jgi:hypothetical protein